MGPNFPAGLAGGRRPWPLVDGLIWSELGAAYPEAGGSVPLSEAGLRRAEMGAATCRFCTSGKRSVQAPLVLASGRHRLCPIFQLPRADEPSGGSQKPFPGRWCLLLMALLYRRIEDIGKLGVFLVDGRAGADGLADNRRIDARAATTVAWLPASTGGFGSALPGVLHLGGAMGQAADQDDLLLPGLLQRVPPGRPRS